ncbi:MAG: class I SAM-dependent methyltransferase [Anaerolineales bacterium]|nr:class I SAM-dependent methyltransferase [Anaerolineales bacterium]
MNLLNRLLFNLWYFRKPPWDTNISPPELFEFIQTHSVGRAIDIGCGTGTNVTTLARAGWQAVGFDFAPYAIQIAKRKIKKENVQADVFVDDASIMKNVKGCFNLALDMGCFHGMENKEDYLINLGKILVPNGFWLMYGFFKAAPHLSSPGLVETDIKMISTHGFTLLSRQNGFDKRERASAWFLYQKT